MKFEGREVIFECEDGTYIECFVPQFGADQGITIDPIDPDDAKVSVMLIDEKHVICLNIESDGRYCVPYSFWFYYFVKCIKKGFIPWEAPKGFLHNERFNVSNCAFE